MKSATDVVGAAGVDAVVDAGVDDAGDSAMTGEPGAPQPVNTATVRTASNATPVGLLDAGVRSCLRLPAFGRLSADRPW
ncbi:MAG: hypothetical protein ABWZ98_11160 [Nakamurella sp.]